MGGEGSCPPHHWIIISRADIAGSTDYYHCQKCGEEKVVKRPWQLFGRPFPSKPHRKKKEEPG